MPGYDNINRKIIKLFNIINTERLDTLFKYNYNNFNKDSFVSLTLWLPKKQNKWRRIAVLNNINGLILKDI